MSQKLHIGEGFNLPKDVVTATTVVYGGKGMGKTNFGSVLVEELTKVNQRWAVLDPLGVWWGLRHSKDGKGPGIQCLILGGPHGDIPIEPTGGVVVADLVADEDVNVIVDFSRKPTGEAWGVAEKIRFVTEFGRRLFQRQSSLVNGKRREPLLVVMDEAARFVPQMVRSGETDLAKCLSVWAQIVEEGRNFGLGVVLLTQRSARLNKDVAELADAMLAFRTVGPNSIDAVTDWLGEHVDKAHIKQIIEQLRSLPRGSCLVVSPGWLQLESIVAVRMRETFDSSATPKPGESARRVTGAAAKPDLEKYAERMKETIEKAKAEDPAALRKRITELQRELAKPVKAGAAPVKEVKVADEKATSRAVAKATDALRRELRNAMNIIAKITAIGFEDKAIKPEEIKAALENASQQIVRIAEQKLASRAKEFARLKTDAERTMRLISRLLSEEHVEVAVTVKHNEPFTVAPSSRPAASHREIIAPANGYSVPHIKILSRLVELLECTGEASVPKEQLAAWAEYSPNSGGFNNYLGTLRSAGAIDYPAGGIVTITEEGRKHAQPDEVPTDSKELLERAKNVLGGSEARILEHVFAQGKEAQISKDELAEAVGLSPNSGGFNNYLGHMRTLGFIDYPQRGMVKCADWMFI